MSTSNDSDAPLVSIVVPCYNYAQFVRHTIDSVLGQTHRNVELIVVENGSTDNSRAVLRYLATELKDDRLVIIEIDENEGPVPAWKRGFERATGKYFGLLPADDYLHKEKLARQVAYLEEHPDIGAVGSYVHQVDEHGNRTRKGRSFEKLVNQDNDLNDFKYWLLEHQLSIPTAIYRKDLCDIAGTPSVGLNHICDWEFHMRLIMAGCRFALLTEPLTYYRWHDSNLSHTGSTEAIPQWAFCYSKYLVPYLKKTGQMDLLPVAVDKFLTRYFPAIADHPENQQLAILRELFHPLEWGTYLNFKKHVETFEPTAIESGTLGGLMHLTKTLGEQEKTLRRVKRTPWVRLGRALGLVKKIRIP